MIPGPFVSNEVLGTAAVLVSLGGTVSYVTSILKGETRPHVFTWLNWGHHSNDRLRGARIRERGAREVGNGDGGGRLPPDLGAGTVPG